LRLFFQSILTDKIVLVIQHCQDGSPRLPYHQWWVREIKPYQVWSLLISIKNGYIATTIKHNGRRGMTILGTDGVTSGHEIESQQNERP
jgi:hypothetical protein